jgi:methionyl-tRNA formyltransferase
LAPHQNAAGCIESDGKNYVKVACANGYIFLEQVQMSGKKAMHIKDFLRGFDIRKIKMLGN